MDQGWVALWGADPLISPMTVKPLIILPDDLLRQKSQNLAQIDASALRLAQDMLETMYHAPGIGLAAIQIGIAVRALVLDVAPKEEAPDPRIFFNPEILWSSQERNIHEEGCLSIPEYFAEVERPKRIRVRYIDAEGHSQELEADGLLATCLQHEIDHLNGILFIDHISRLKREMVIKKFKKRARTTQELETVL